ncbi:VOC family protein [Ruegeria arenilitoris]|uniref:VOC family protein n=1 Tax=Ruegeria arenilitoris TaxID=1173585 RepID=UPI00147F5E22|nr:VOC family protein [Ruegeria arenilitoris]
MTLSNGCNHVTIVTKDVDRFIEFYTTIFEAEVRLDLDEGMLRHALIDMGCDFCLHPFQVNWQSEHEEGLSEIFARGHVDHFALNISDESSFDLLRKRLVECGASEGRVRDFGIVQVLSFQDPDGMECELALWKEGEPLTMAESKSEAYAA